MKKLFAYLLVLCIFTILIYHLRQNWDTVRAIPWGDHLFLLSFHWVSLLFMFLVFIWGWMYAVHIHGYKIRWKSAARTWLVPNLGKYIPGKVFMLAGRVEMSRKIGIRPVVSFSAMVMENALMVFAALPFFFWSVLYGLNIPGRHSVAILTVFILLGLWICTQPKKMIQCLNFVNRKFGHGLLNVYPKPQYMFALVGIYFLGWIFYGFSGMLLTHALELAKGVSWFTLAASFISSWVIGYLTLITPSGLGVREMVLVGLLTPEIPAAQAITLALVARLSWTVTELAGVGVGLFFKDIEEYPSV